MQNENENNSFSIKLLIFFSLILFLLDFVELFVSFKQLKLSMKKFDHTVFEECIKYHILSQIGFTIFAIIAALLVFLLSLVLLINSGNLNRLLLKVFLYFAYFIFGPYLLAFTSLGFMNFQKISFYCIDQNAKVKIVNLSTVISLVICFIFSAIITAAYSFVFSMKKMADSVRFRRNGWRTLGILFWKYVRRENREANDIPRNRVVDVPRANEEVIEANQNQQPLLENENDNNSVRPSNNQRLVLTTVSVGDLNNNNSDNQNNEEFEKKKKKIEMLRNIIKNARTDEARNRALTTFRNYTGRAFDDDDDDNEIVYFETRREESKKIEDSHN